MSRNDTLDFTKEEHKSRAKEALATGVMALAKLQDKLYVGFNNGFGCIVPNGRTSTLDVTQSAAAAAPTFGLDVIEARNSACQDGFAQVPAPNLDGTVYAAFIHDWSGSPRVVVVRDDVWGTSGSPFTALNDPSDM